jgi:hypothetical protein
MRWQKVVRTELLPSSSVASLTAQVAAWLEILARVWLGTRCDGLPPAVRAGHQGAVDSDTRIIGKGATNGAFETNRVIHRDSLTAAITYPNYLTEYAFESMQAENPLRNVSSRCCCSVCVCSWACCSACLLAFFCWRRPRTAPAVAPAAAPVPASSAIAPMAAPPAAPFAAPFTAPPFCCCAC